MIVLYFGVYWIYGNLADASEKEFVLKQFCNRNASEVTNQQEYSEPNSYKKVISSIFWKKISCHRSVNTTSAMLCCLFVFQHLLYAPKSSFTHEKSLNAAFFRFCDIINGKKEQKHFILRFKWNADDVLFVCLWT